MRTRLLVIGVSAIAVAAAIAAGRVSRSVEASPAYAGEVERWRAERERDLQSDTGWLTVAGLAFLQPGINTAGSSPDNDVVLPEPAPKRAGRFVRDGRIVAFEPEPHLDLTLNGQALAGRVILSDRDRVGWGSVTWQLHTSGDRIGIRIRDTHSELRRSFNGLSWFPIREAWRLDGRFLPYESPRTITVPNVLGDYETLSVPGEVAIRIGDRDVRLQAAQSGNGLWFIFSDRLGGRDTYHIRFLHAEAPGADGHVVVDFNRAYNPPCAYNPFTTCPLPPPQNRLDIAIDAGERRYHAH
jgi:uncharacterized protein (DUF1684 family)